MKTLYPEAGSTAGYINSAFWLSMTLGRLIAVGSLKRFSLGNLIPVHMLGALTGMVVLLTGSATIVLIWAGTLLSGLMMGAVFPFIMGFSDEKVGLTGRNGGFIFTGTSLGAMIFPFLNGKLFTFIAPEALVVSMMICVTVSLQIFLFLRRR